MKDIIAENSKTPVIIFAASGAPGNTREERDTTVELALDLGAATKGVQPVKLQKGVGRVDGITEEIYIASIESPGQADLVLHFADFNDEDYVVLVNKDRLAVKAFMKTRSFSGIGKLEWKPAHVAEKGDYTLVDGNYFVIGEADEVDIKACMEKHAGMFPSRD